MPDPRVLIRLRKTFDASHQLPYHQGKCARLHGHTYRVEVGLSGPVRADRPEDPQSGMVLDFASVKSALAGLLPDHLSLNDPVGAEVAHMSVPDRQSTWRHGLRNPTAERLAVLLYDLLKDAERTFDGAVIEYVRVWETDSADATYSGSEAAR